MHTHESLKGKVVVITGGAGILCGGFSKVLAENGAKIAVLDLKLDLAKIVSDEITEKGGVAIPIACDVLSPENMEAAHQEVLSKLGPCDILINGAGGNNPRGTTTHETLTMEDFTDKKEGIQTFFDMDPKGFEFVFGLNFMGTLIPTQVFAKDMIGRKGCSILNIASVSAYSPLTKIPAYSAAKAAIYNFTEFMAVHFGDMGIRVNALSPGFFVTNQNRNLLLNADGSYTARSHKILGHTPARRFGEPEELYGGLLYLCDPEEASFVNGIVLPIDGGFLASSGI